MNEKIIALFICLMLMHIQPVIANGPHLHILDRSKPPKILSDYLRNYFGSNDYSVFEEKLDLGDRKLLIAVHLVNSENQILDKGLGVEVKDGKIKPYIYFEKMKILNGDRKIIVDVTSFHYPYFGWKVYYPNRKYSSSSHAGFSFDYCDSSRGGGADSILVDWDTNKKKFEEAHPHWN